MKILKDILGEAGFNEGLVYMLDYCRSLWRGLKNDRVTSQEGRYERIDKN